MSPSVSVRLLLTQSDARLVELARAGHERAFEALVQRYRRPLLGYCRGLLLPPERAEDALQQALLQAWLALRDGAEVRNVKPWLYRIVHNAALNMLRRSGYDYATLSETLTGAGAPSEDLDRRIAVREALAGLAALPQMQREALLRTAVDGSSYQQAATTMGLSETALRGLVHRARLTLRAAATALTPSPLVSWALGIGGADAPLTSRLGEAVASGGSIGLAGIIAKAGATAVTAGVLVGGIGTLHHHHQPPNGGRKGESASATASSGTGQGSAVREVASNGENPDASSGLALAPTHAAPHHPRSSGAPPAGSGVRRVARHHRRRLAASPISHWRPTALATRPGGSGTRTPTDGGGSRYGSGGRDGGGSHTGGGSHEGGHNRDGASQGSSSGDSGNSSGGGHGTSPSGSDSPGGSDSGGAGSGDGSAGATTQGSVQRSAQGPGSPSTDSHSQESPGSSDGSSEETHSNRQ